MFRARRLLPTSARAGLALGISALLLAGTTTAAQAKSSTPAPTAETPAAAHHRASHGKSVPLIAQDWLSAWNTGDADRMASLFTPDGTYTDHAFGASFTGPDGVAQWVTITTSSISDIRGDIRWARRYGKTVVVSWTFHGHITGAPSAFTVPAITVLRLNGSKIASDNDYYKLADVLRQSGLPADWSPTA